MNKPNNGSKSKIPDSRDDIPENGPQTLLQFLKLLIVGMITGFRKNIPFIIGLSLLAWLVHTYLLVVVNEGFYPSNPEATSMLALAGSKLSGTLFWTLLGMIGMNLLYKIRQGRLNHTIKNIGTSPKWVRLSHKQAGPFAIPIILGASALGLYFGVKLNNPLVNLQFAFILFGGIIAQRESMLTLALHLFWSDTHRLLKMPKGKFNLPGAVMGITGATLGFIFAIFLAKSTFFGLLAIIVLLGLMVAFVLKQRGKIGGRALPALIILIYVCIIIMIPAFADDGGWQESGGTLDQWITSEGALIAISMGLPPAIGMGLGGLLGLAAAQGTFVYGGQPDLEGDGWEGTEGGDAGKPEDEGDAERPEEEGDAGKPDEEGDTERPEDEGDAERPDGEGDAGKPDEEGEAEKPDEEGDTERPDGEGDAGKPDEEGETEKPDEEGEAEKVKAEREEAEREEAERQEAIEKRKEEIRKSMEESQKEADKQNARANFFGNLVTIFSVVEKTADVGVDVLSTMTGPAGQAVKTAYTATKDITKNMSDSYAKGESMVDGALKGAGEAVVDIALDKFGGAVVDKFGGKIPGFGKFESAVDYSKESVTAFKNLVKEAGEEGAKNVASEGLKEAGKNALQGQIQGESLWNPFKKFLGF